jgi:hypothetical protein
VDGSPARDSNPRHRLASAKDAGFHPSAALIDNCQNLPLTRSLTPESSLIDCWRSAAFRWSCARNVSANPGSSPVFDFLVQLDPAAFIVI